MMNIVAYIVRGTWAGPQEAKNRPKEIICCLTFSMVQKCGLGNICEQELARRCFRVGAVAFGLLGSKGSKPWELHQMNA